MTIQIARLYCLTCVMCFPVLRPEGAESLAEHAAGVSAQPCPRCGNGLVFFGVFELPYHRDLQRTLHMVLHPDVLSDIAALKAGGATRRQLRDPDEQPPSPQVMAAREAVARSMLGGIGHDQQPQPPVTAEAGLWSDLGIKWEDA